MIGIQENGVITHALLGWEKVNWLILNLCFQQDQSDRVSSLSAEIKALQAELEQAANRITELEGSKTELEVTLAQLKEQKDGM